MDKKTILGDSMLKYAQDQLSGVTRIVVKSANTMVAV